MSPFPSFSDCFELLSDGKWLLLSNTTFHSRSLMGKNWWKQASGLSNLQRKASRSLGIPPSRSGRRQKMKRSFGPFAPGNGPSGCGKTVAILLFLGAEFLAVVAVALASG